MKARLAFMISMLKVPEVLFVDKALDVGNRDFREKNPPD